MGFGFGRQEHREESFQLLTVPFFIATDVERPPGRISILRIMRLVLCVDEKTRPFIHSRLHQRSSPSGSWTESFDRRDHVRGAVMMDGMSPKMSPRAACALDSRKRRPATKERSDLAVGERPRTGGPRFRQQLAPDHIRPLVKPASHLSRLHFCKRIRCSPMPRKVSVLSHRFLGAPFARYGVERLARSTPCESWQIDSDAWGICPRQSRRGDAASLGSRRASAADRVSRPSAQLCLRRFQT